LEIEFNGEPDYLSAYGWTLVGIAFSPIVVFFYWIVYRLIIRCLLVGLADLALPDRMKLRNRSKIDPKKLKKKTIHSVRRIG